MLSPCACVSTSWLLLLTVAVMPVVPLCWLIALTRPARLLAFTVPVTVAEMLTVLLALALTSPSVNEKEPDVTVKAALVSATALTLVLAWTLLTDATISLAASALVTATLEPPAEPDTPIEPAVKPPAAPDVMMYDAPVLSLTPPVATPLTLKMPAAVFGDD